MKTPTGHLPQPTARSAAILAVRRVSVCFHTARVVAPRVLPARVGVSNLRQIQILNADRDWSVPRALTTPGLVRSRAGRGKLDAKKRSQLREQLVRVAEIAARNRDAKQAGAMALHRIAQWLAEQWPPDNSDFLNAS